MYTTQRDAFALLAHPHLVNAIRRLGGQVLHKYMEEDLHRFISSPEYEKVMLGHTLQPSGFPSPDYATPIVSKLSFLSEGGCKTRVIAIADY